MDRNNGEEWYRAGVENAKNPEKALSCYRAAAELGHPEAMEELGARLEWGQGCEINTPEAAGWYEKAAMAGVLSAATALGLLYYQGAEDFQRDWEKAEEWLTMAAEGGDEEAEDVLDALLTEMEARQRQKDRKAKKKNDNQRKNACKGSEPGL